MAVTNAFETSFNILKRTFEEKGKELPKVIKFVDKIPIVYLMFVVCAGLTVQLRFLYPAFINKYSYKLLSVLTNGKGDRVARNFIEILMGYK